MNATITRAVGTDLARVEGAEKVSGQAAYANDYRPEQAAHVAIVQSTIARGSVKNVDAGRALAEPGVLAVLWHGNAPRLSAKASGELAVLQSPQVVYRGQIVGAVVAKTREAAEEAARLVAVEYAEEPHDTELRADHPRLYKPDTVNPNFDTDSEEGDFDSAFAASPVSVDVTYSTPAEHNNPMEPHATTACWHQGLLTVYDSTQGAHAARRTVADVFGLDERRVRVVSPHVGGGFGSKGTLRPHSVLAVMAAMHTARPARLAVSRHEMFRLTGYRTPTIQRLRLGAESDGRLIAIAHDVWEQSSRLAEFAEQTAVPTRMMYSGPHRRTTHRLVQLDLPTPSWMRAPGETPGMYALESAMDELAVACAIDPVELRIRNEPAVDPETGLPFSSRGLAECLREGAERFGWDGNRAPGIRRDGRFLVGTGVASSTYPARRRGSQASARAEDDGTFVVSIGASDVGTGARTALKQIAADALGVDVERVCLELGDTRFPFAPLAGGSMGLASWGTAVVKACRELAARDLEGEAVVDTTEDVEADRKLARHAFGAQFAEARVDVDSGEVHVQRLLGVFAAGRIVNPRLARSQLIGGMTMGLSMALHEESILDPRFGDYVNHDFAGYHVAACADVAEIDAVWIDEHDDDLNPMGAKGIGEIGIVGTAAAIGNAVYHATGIRIRDLPLRLDKLVGQL